MILAGAVGEDCGSEVVLEGLLTEAERAGRTGRENESILEL